MANATILHRTNSGDQYAELPLSSNRKCIRVIDIQNASENEPIRGDLRIIDLERSPVEPFTAISYVWGAYSNPSDAILCGDTPVKVTANCFSALRHLRKALGSLTIWVDAICINQKDDIEKSHQIPLMDQVYSLANAVYVWLGESNENSDRAMDYLANAGYLDFFDRSTMKRKIGSGLEEEKPRPWAAAWSAYMSTWTLHRNPFVRDSK
jgi:Heterokaryon incompatibility protein (HET)